MPDVLDVSAVVLTGGKAARMIPLSLRLNKAMIPFMGKPLLLHLVNALESSGITDVVMTSSGKRHEIADFFADQAVGQMRFRYPELTGPGGTAGWVRTVACGLRDTLSDPFIVIYGDSLLRVDYRKLLQYHSDRNSECTILYHRPQLDSFLYEYHDNAFPIRGKRTNYGVLSVAKDSRVTYIEEKPLLSDLVKWQDPLANAAVYVLSKRVLDFVPPDQPSDFPRDVFPALLKAMIPMYGFDIGDGYREDIGTLRKYYIAQMDVLRQNLKFDHYYPIVQDQVMIGANALVTPTATILSPSIIGDNAEVGADSTVHLSVIGDGCRIGRSCQIDSCILHDDVIVGNECRIKGLIVGQGCMLGPGANLPPGSVLGERSIICMPDIIE